MLYNEIFETQLGLSARMFLFCSKLKFLRPVSMALALSLAHSIRESFTRAEGCAR